MSLDLESLLWYIGVFCGAVAGFLYLRSRPIGYDAPKRKRLSARDSQRAAQRREAAKATQAAEAASVASQSWRAVDRIPEAQSISVSDFHQDVAQLLLKVLEREPSRSDLRWKLLEAYYVGGQRQAFIDQAQEYRKHVKGDKDEHWDKIARMGLFLAPGHPLFTKPIAAPPADAAEPAAATVEQPAKNRRYHEAIAPERIGPALNRLDRKYSALRHDAGFRAALAEEFRDVLGRPTPLTAAPDLGQPPHLELFLKREDHRGADEYRLLNTLGQVLLAKKLGARRVIAGTAFGHHGVAVAMAAARRGLACTIHVTPELIGSALAARMKELGAEIQSARSTLSVTTLEPRQAALVDWIENEDSALFVSGLSGGPSPYSNIVFDQLAVIGDEVAAQLRARTQAPLRYLIASRNCGAELFGFISPFLQQSAIDIVLVETPGAEEATEPQLRLNREHNWLEATGRVHYIRVPEELAQATVKHAMTEHSLKLELPDGYVLAGGLQLAAGVTTPASMVVLASTPTPGR